jgi:geranylgeranyl pyrophosphate synthase
MENSKNGATELLMGAYRSDTISEVDINSILQALEDNRAQQEAQEMVEQYCNRASGELATLNLSYSAIRDLQEIVSFLMERNF